VVEIVGRFAVGLAGRDAGAGQALHCLGVYRLSEQANNAAVAAGSTLLTARIRFFFAQSSLVHLDLAAAGFTCWALRRIWMIGVFAMFAWFALAGLAKENGDSRASEHWRYGNLLDQRCFRKPNKLVLFPQSSLDRLAALAASALPLVLWFAYH